MHEEYLDIIAASRSIAVHPDTLRRAARNALLPCRRIRRKLFFRADHLRTFREARDSAKPPARIRGTIGRHLSQIEKALAGGGS